MSLNYFGRAVSFKVPHDYSAILSANFSRQKPFSSPGGFLSFKLRPSMTINTPNSPNDLPASKVPLLLKDAQIAKPSSKYSSIASGSSTLWNGSINSTLQVDRIDRKQNTYFTNPQRLLPCNLLFMDTWAIPQDCCLELFNYWQCFHLPGRARFT